MAPRLDISFPLCHQWQYLFGQAYQPQTNEFLLNHARTGIVLALRAVLPNGGKVGVVAYNCHTVANAVVNAGCTPLFIDITRELTIDVEKLPVGLEAIIVTNLFGIRNDIEAIKAKCSKTVIIVDNAHGFGLPEEGDFTIYSINQGKFPSLGEGGILKVNTIKYNERITTLYQKLPTYSYYAQIKLFAKMWLKALAYSPCCYWLVRWKKKDFKRNVYEKVVLRKMANGVKKMYCAALPDIDKRIAIQKKNAEFLRALGYDVCVGENAFMAIIECERPENLKREFARKGIETATHFGKAIEWAHEFGYIEGSCPQAERLTKRLLMIPTYIRI